MRISQLLLAIFVLFSTSVLAQKDSISLEKIIRKFQEHKPYERSNHPLGLYTKEHYKTEASFAETLLNELKNI